MQVERAALGAGGVAGVALVDGWGGVMMGEEEGEKEAGGASADDCNARELVCGLGGHCGVFCLKEVEVVVLAVG